MTTAGSKPVRDLPTVRSLGINEVRESATNPRKISDKAVDLVAQSIRRFGWKQPLVVDRNHKLIVGHTRHRAARSLGLTHVPVIIADDLTPAEVNAYRIADNRSHDYTTWDMPELAKQLEEMAAEGFSEVLDLANWEVALAELEQMTEDADNAALAELDLPAEVKGSLDGDFQLGVVFASKEEALAAEAAILDLPGVLDVRHKL